MFYDLNKIIIKWLMVNCIKTKTISLKLYTKTKKIFCRPTKIPLRNISQISVELVINHSARHNTSHWTDAVDGLFVWRSTSWEPHLLVLCGLNQTSRLSGDDFEARSSTYEWVKKWGGCRRAEGRNCVRLLPPAETTASAPSGRMIWYFT